MSNYLILCLIALGMIMAGNHSAKENGKPTLATPAAITCVVTGPICVGGVIMIYMDKSIKGK